MNDANDRRFSAGLAKSCGVKRGQPVLFLKHETPYVVATFYKTREDFISGKTVKGDVNRKWMTVSSAQKLAKKLNAVVVDF